MVNGISGHLFLCGLAFSGPDESSPMHGLCGKRHGKLVGAFMQDRRCMLFSGRCRQQIDIICKTLAYSYLHSRCVPVITVLDG